MRMDIEQFAYDVKEGLEEGEVCFIISPSYKDAQLKRVKELSKIPFRVINMGENGADGYMLDPAKCGVERNGKLVYKSSYPDCKRFVDKSLFSAIEKVVLLESEYTYECFEEYPVFETE